jgi:hypothetical protein
MNAAAILCTHASAGHHAFFGTAHYFPGVPMMRKVLVICSLLLTCAVSAPAQKGKPWTDWNVKEATRVFNDSGWGQTQTESETNSQPTQTSAVSSTTAAKERNVRDAGSAARSSESGERKEDPTVHYYVRFMTAKPIRAAYVRLAELQCANAEKLSQLKTLVDREFGDIIVVTVSMDGTDRKKMGPVLQELMSADTDGLKGTTFLERKDGKRIALSGYRAPQDAFGAKFVFPRTVDGKPFLDNESGEVRFITEVGKIKLNRRFKVNEMIYEGKLEY